MASTEREFAACDDSITAWLQRARDGDAEAREALALRLYGELRRLASRHLRHQRRGHTLQATALVHEAWIKLAGGGGVPWRDRAHFLVVASAAMRQLLIDHARTRGRVKRGGEVRRQPLDGLLLAYEERAGDMLAIEESLAALQAFDPEMAQVVDLRFFGQATMDECAAIVGLPKRTLERRWEATRAWLRARLSGGAR
jgi:RNA polymerase sigma factor (TIGR02999 family)